MKIVWDYGRVFMDYKEYKQLYQQLMSDKGRAEIGDDSNRTAEVEAKINKFLASYPDTIPITTRKDAQITQLPLHEVYRRCLTVMIDIINDISRLLSERDTMSSTNLRRQIFYAITNPERRLYVGIWLIFISMVLYFIDSSS